MAGAFQRRRDKRRERRRGNQFRSGSAQRSPERADAAVNSSAGRNPAWRYGMGLAGAATAKLGEFWPEGGS